MDSDEPGPESSASLSSTLTRRSATVSSIVWAATACLLAITTVPPGATRVFSWPWSIVYAATLLAPPCLLLLRAFDRRRPLALPSEGWLWTTIGMVATVLASALLSPHRGSSLLWSAPLLSALAVFLVAFDAVHSEPNARITCWRGYTMFFVLVALASAGEWLSGLRHVNIARLVAGRNAYPLGHSNYTAGLGLLLLPVCAAAAVRSGASRPTRLAGVGGVSLALLLLFSSGSRGGMSALGAVALAALIAAPLRRTVKWRLAALTAVAGLGIVAANPRTRAMLRPAESEGPPNISNVQRHAMLRAGQWMGADRPLLGWGPGTTPLVFPRYRARLDGGAEDVLQLHCLPVQLWAELGFAGLVCAGAFVVLAWRGRRHEPTAALTLLGYGVFSLFDAQLDIPVFGFGIATLAALLASPARAHRSRATLVGVVTLSALALVALLGRAGSAAALNTAALAAAHRGDHGRAVRELRDSLALNPEQEIAHFNLGWLLVVDDPVAAAHHFSAAAHLVPDKGGVYFGLGLARLNSGDETGAAHAFAIEALNDPVFLLSPWWENARLASVRARTWDEIASLERKLEAALPATSWSGRELRYVGALAPWVIGRAPASSVAAVANTDPRREFFAGNPSRTVLESIGTEKLQRERVGYPVLMRDLDSPPPIDVWVVHQSKARDSALAFLWPDKGWLPSPLLIALLDGTDSSKK